MSAGSKARPVADAIVIVVASAAMMVLLFPLNETTAGRPLGAPKLPSEWVLILSLFAPYAATGLAVLVRPGVSAFGFAKGVGLTGTILLALYVPMVALLTGADPEHSIGMHEVLGLIMLGLHGAMWYAGRHALATAYGLTSTPASAWLAPLFVVALFMFLPGLQRRDDERRAREEPLALERTRPAAPTPPAPLAPLFSNTPGMRDRRQQEIVVCLRMHFFRVKSYPTELRELGPGRDGCLDEYTAAGDIGRWRALYSARTGDTPAFRLVIVDTTGVDSARVIVRGDTAGLTPIPVSQRRTR